MLLVAGGHIGLVMLIVKSGWLKRLISRLAAEGKRQNGKSRSQKTTLFGSARARVLSATARTRREPAWLPGSGAVQ